MISLLIATLFLLLGKLFLASKDATSYLLKDKKDNELTDKRINRWHTIGVALDIWLTAPVAYILGPNWWEVCINSILLRLAMYDLAFNYWGHLSITHLGSSAWWDQQFIKLFGEEGAIKKSIFFAICIVAFMTAKVIFKF